jgi:hypothetical protein
VKLSIRHEKPASAETINARAVMCRLIHALHGDGSLVILTEHSTPESFGFALECQDSGTWAGLGDVLDTLAPPSWFITPDPPFTLTGLIG